MRDSEEDMRIGRSLPPGSLSSTALEPEEKALKKGRAPILWVSILIPLVAVAAVVAYLVANAEGDQHRTLGKNINLLRRDHFDAFWACALDGSDVAHIDNNAELSFEIIMRVKEHRSRYTAHVRDKCLPYLEDLAPGLTQLIPPEELVECVDLLGNTAETLDTSWRGYLAYLEAVVGEPYNESEGDRHVTRIARAWYEYRVIHQELNTAVGEVIGD